MNNWVDGLSTWETLGLIWLLALLLTALAYLAARQYERRRREGELVDRSPGRRRRNEDES